MQRSGASNGFTNNNPFNDSKNSNNFDTINLNNTLNSFWYADSKKDSMNFMKNTQGFNHMQATNEFEKTNFNNIN